MTSLRGPVANAYQVALEGTGAPFYDLFKPNSTFLFDEHMLPTPALAVPSEADFDGQTPQWRRAMENFSNERTRRKEARDALASRSLRHIWEAGINTADEYAKKDILLVNNPGLAQFIVMREDGGFKKHIDDASQMKWLKNYLAAISTAQSVSSSKKKVVASVLIRPIRFSGSTTSCAYYITPVDVSTEVEDWARCGFKVKETFRPLDLTWSDELVYFFMDKHEDKFRIPIEVADFIKSKFARFWAMCADDLNNVVEEAVPAVPLIPYSFGNMSGNINIAVGGAANQDVSDYVPPSFDLPLTPEQLKYVRGEGRPHYGDHKVAEPDNKLAAAIGTAAAAMITVGVAAALSS